MDVLMKRVLGSFKRTEKLKGSSLMEVMVATVLLVVIFTIAGLVIRNGYKQYYHREQAGLQEHLQTLKYKALAKKIQLPYIATYGHWEIHIALKETSLELTTIDTQTGAEQHNTVYDVWNPY